MMYDNKTGLFLLRLSRETIKFHLNRQDIRDIIKKDTAPEEILKDGACFVTLTSAGDLRGCIGSMEPYRTLFEDVISNSINAAFRDTRFAPVTKNEMKDIKIEISILSERKKVQYADFRDLKKQIKPNIHGVYLTYTNHSATFLPQVWEQLISHEQFFIHLSQKAGLSPDFVFNNKPMIEVYTVEKFKE